MAKRHNISHTRKKTRTFDWNYKRFLKELEMEATVQAFRQNKIVQENRFQLAALLEKIV